VCGSERWGWKAEWTCAGRQGTRVSWRLQCASDVTERGCARCSICCRRVRTCHSGVFLAVIFCATCVETSCGRTTLVFVPLVAKKSDTRWKKPSSTTELVMKWQRQRSGCYSWVSSLPAAPMSTLYAPYISGRVTMTTESSINTCITTDQLYSKSNHNPTTKQHADTVSIQLNIVICPTMYPEKCTRDNAISPFLQLSVVIVTLPIHKLCNFYK